MRRAEAAAVHRFGAHDARTEPALALARLAIGGGGRASEILRRHEHQPALLRVHGPVVFHLGDGAQGVVALGFPAPVIADEPDENIGLLGAAAAEFDGRGRARAELLHGVEAEPIVAARVFDELRAIGAKVGAGGGEEYGFAHGAAA